MSVDYNTYLVCGWAVSSDDRVDMLETGGWENFEDCFIGTNYYISGGDYIFGEKIAYACEGCYEPVDMMDCVIDEDSWHEALIKCGRPDLAQLHPTIYLINQVS